MKTLYASGWLLLLMFTDSGLVKQGGDYETKQECNEAWQEIRQCYAKMLPKEKAKAEKNGCFLYCGQPFGYCVEGERMTAPGIIFSLPDKENSCE